MLIASARGLQQQLMTPEALRARRQTLRPGDRFDVGPALSGWLAAGYEPVTTVEGPGQFSRRGGIIDVFPPGADGPVRIELFGDEIDSLRPFDPVTQRSTGRLRELTILPASELPLWNRAAALDRLRALDIASLRPEVLAEWGRGLEMLEGTETPPVQDLFAPYFSPAPARLTDYLALGAVVVFDEPGAARLAADQVAAQAEELRLGFEAGGGLPRGLLRPYHTWAEVQAGTGAFARLDLGQGEDPDAPTDAWAMLREPAAYAGRIARLAGDLTKATRAGRRTVIVTEQSARLRELLAERDIFPAAAEDRLPSPCRR